MNADVPLRIALLTHSFNPRGGVVHTIELAQALHDAGHAVTVYAPAAAGEQLFRPVPFTVERVDVPPTPRGDVAAMVEARIAAFERHLGRLGQRLPALPPFDVFHAQDPIGANALANLQDRGLIRGFVRTVHHLDDFADARLAAWQRRGYQRAAQVLCVSRLWQEVLREQTPPVEARLVPNGVDCRRFGRADDLTGSTGSIASIASTGSTGSTASIASNASLPSTASTGSPASTRLPAAPDSLAVSAASASPAASRPSDAALLAGLGLRQGAAAGEPIFLAVGGIEERKNTLRILQAFLLARVRWPRAQLVVAGGASLLDHDRYASAFRVAAAAAGLAVSEAGRSLPLLGADASLPPTGADASLLLTEPGAPLPLTESDFPLLLTGPVPDAVMPALMRRSDALVTPSLREGFGLVVLEALACGTPVVVSRIAPYTEYLGDADCCWADPLDVASIAEAMAAAIEPARVAALARALPAVCLRFNWPASAARHLEVYRPLADRSPAIGSNREQRPPADDRRRPASAHWQSPLGSREGEARCP